MNGDNIYKKVKLRKRDMVIHLWYLVVSFISKPRDQCRPNDLLVWWTNNNNIHVYLEQTTTGNINEVFCLQSESQHDLLFPTIYCHMRCQYQHIRFKTF